MSLIARVEALYYDFVEANGFEPERLMVPSDLHEPLFRELRGLLQLGVMGDFGSPRFMGMRIVAGERLEVRAPKLDLRVVSR